MPNAQQLIDHVRLGTHDFVLLRPVDAHFFVSVLRIKFTVAAWPALVHGRERVGASGLFLRPRRLVRNVHGALVATHSLQVAGAFDVQGPVAGRGRAPHEVKATVDRTHT